LVTRKRSPQSSIASPNPPELPLVGSSALPSGLKRKLVAGILISAARRGPRIVPPLLIPLAA